MGLVYPRVCIQARITHDSIDEVIHHGGDAVDTAEPIVKAGRILSSHWLSVVRDFETGGGVNQERVWRIMVDVTRLVCGEATDGFGWSCV